MDHLVTFTLLTLTSFFTLINPLGAMPIFLSLTNNWAYSEKRAVARKSIVVSFIILMLFAISGQILFRFFNITVDSFKIVGGMIFFNMGFKMLNAEYKSTKATIDERSHDIAITPLAIPMITGPGAITNAIVLMEEAYSIEMKVILLVGIAVVLLAAYLILINSIRILEIIGDTGNNVMMRLMGMIVMVIAVEFILAGIRPFIDSFLL